MKIKLQIPDIIILLAIGSTLLYVVFNYLPKGIGSFRFFWAPLSLIIIFYYRSVAFTKDPMTFVLLWGALSAGILQYTLWNNMDDWNRKSVLEDFFNLAVFTAILNYYWVKGDFKRLALLSKWAFVFIVITIITTNIALTIDPLIVRNSANSFLGDPSQKRISKLFGTAGYGYAQSLLLLIPILVYHIKARKQMVFSSKILIIILVLIIITTIRAQVFANLMVAALTTLLSMMGSKNRHLAYRYVAIFIIIYVIIPSSFYANIFTTLGSYFEPGTELNYKMNDFASFIETPEFTGSSGVGGRAERYPLLLEALLAKPVFGYASYKYNINLGGGVHLYWMNHLALWGIPGFLIFVFVLYKIYKTINSSFFDTEIRHYYLLSVLAFIMLGLIKTIAGREPWLMLIVVIPGLYFFPLIRKKGNKMAIQNNNIKDGNN